MSTLPRVIGIAGFAGSGKDTAADHLVREYGYVKVSWADKLREAAAALDPIVGAGIVAGEARTIRYTELVSWCGYAGAKAHPDFGFEFRRTLMRLGTEMGRTVFGENFWVDQLVGSLDWSSRYVVPDTRFPNEARAVVAAGGKVIRIARPGVGPVADHPSETSLVDWPYAAVITNSDTVPMLGWALDGWLKERAA